MIILLFPCIGFGAKVKVKDCKMSFATIGKPVLIQIKGGSTKNCTGTASLKNNIPQSADIKLSLEHIDTGIELRNKHLKENYLNTEKYKFAQFKLNKAKTDSKKFTGTMDFQGVKKTITGTYEINDKKVTAEFFLGFPEFNIKPPSFMGVTVTDKVRIEIVLTVGS